MTSSSVTSTSVPAAAGGMIQLLWSRVMAMLTGRGSITLADQAVQSATSFITGIIVARSCTPAQFGVYILGLRLVDIALEVGNVTIWAPFTVLLPRLRGERQNRYIRHTAMHQLIVACALAAVMLVAGIVFVRQGDGEALGRVMLMLAVMLLPILFREYARRLGFARLDMTSVLCMDGIVAVMQLLGLFALTRVRTIGPEHVYAVIGIAAALGTAIGFSHARRTMTVRLRGVVADWRRNWVFGKWFIGGNLTLLASTQIYPWSLSALHGTAATAMLGAGEGVVNLMRAVLMAAQNLLGPLTAHAYATGKQRDVRRLVWWATALLGSGTALFCIGVFFGGEWLVTLLYGPRFAGLGPMLFVMSLNILCMALTVGPSYALAAMGRPDANMYVNIVVLSVSATAGLWLVWQYGAIGAALGLLIGNGVATVIRHIVFVLLSREEVPAV